MKRIGEQLYAAWGWTVFIVGGVAIGLYLVVCAVIVLMSLAGLRP